MIPNPYEPPQIGVSTDRRKAPSTVRHALSVFAALGVFILAFGGLLICTSLIQKGQRLEAVAVAMGFLMISPFLTDESLDQRIAFSLSVPFGMVGGTVGGCVYLAMFHFEWFNYIFNDKGGGPIGLLVSVLGSAFLLGACAFRLMLARLSRFAVRREDKSGSPNVKSLTDTTRQDSQDEGTTDSGVGLA